MQTFIGNVISTKTEKTVTVAVRRRFRHPIYKKSMNSTKKFHVHDESGTLMEGDTVRFTPCKPMSKTKKWIITEVISGPSVDQKNAASETNAKKKVETKDVTKKDSAKGATKKKATQKKR